MSKIKKLLTYLLGVTFAVVLALACVTLGVNNKANAAETADDFKVSSIGIRLQDNAVDTGVRFGVRIKSELLEKTDAKVTLYVLPQMFYAEGAHLNAGAATAQSVELVGEWEADGDYKNGYAYIYDFPASNYGVKLLAEACLTYTENGATVTKWTDVSAAYSLTDVAKTAKDGGKTGVDNYIIENARITYKNVVGEQVGSENLTYGATLNYPEVAGRNGQDLKWTTSKKTAWNTSWTAQGNMTLICAGDTIDEKVFSSRDITSEIADESAPQGFTNVWKTKDKFAASGSNQTIRAEYYSSKDITVYKEVYFAAKTNWMYRLSSGPVAANGWFYFTLTQNEDKTWNTSISYTTQGVVKTDMAENLTMPTENSSLYKAGSLAALLYNPWYIPYVKDAESYVYFTELRGVKKSTEIVGEVVSESALKSGQYSATTEEAVPEGYEKVWMKTLGAGVALYGDSYSNNDLSGYSEVNFALKISDGQTFRMYELGYISSAEYSDWLYFNLVRNNDESWLMTVKCNGSVVYTKNGIVGKTSDGKEVSNTLAGILYFGECKYFPKGTSTGSSNFYFTELRGIRKPVEITGDKIVDCVYDNIGTDCYGKKVTFTDSSEAVPEGFTVVKEYTCSETSLQGKMTHVDIKGYSEVHFAIKTSGYMQIDTSVDSSKAIKQKYEDWLYFTLINESITGKVQWRVKVAYQGNEIVNFLNTRNITQSGVCGVLWHGGAAGTMPYDNTAGFKIYTTELRGTLKPTQTTLAKSGATEYRIVVPDKSESVDNYGAATRAASELKTFFREATGADLGDYVQDTGNLKSDIKYISIGFTNTLNNNVEGVDYDALGISGYSIKTVNGNVFISGQGAGLMNGVYEFLRAHFNYEYYTDGFHKIDDCSNEEVVLQTINEEYKPSFEYRLPSYGFEISATGGYATDKMVGYRMQYNNLSIKGVGGVQWHNFFAAIPKSEYGSQHPDWFSPDGTQLCLTRDKDGLAAEMANKVKSMLDANPSATFVMIGQQDNDDWCNCSACQNVISQYGGYNSATYILFMNAVSDKLQSYLNESGRTDVKLGMFAYHKTQDAPVTTVGGEVTLIGGMKLNSNVCVVYAPIEANYYVSFNDAVNASVKKNIEGWSLVADNVLYWTYMENFGYYQLIFDNFGSMQENLQLLHKHKGWWIYNLAQYNNGNSTGFSRLKAYLNSKLMWNVNADVAALTDDFFGNYFGVASSYMRKYFDEYRVMTKYIYENEDKTIGKLSINGHVPSGKDFWYSKLTAWLGYIDNALAEADKLAGVNDEECVRVRNAVTLESLFVRYALITYYSGKFQSDKLLTMKQTWKADAAKLGVTMCGEHKTLETLYTEWGV